MLFSHGCAQAALSWDRQTSDGGLARAVLRAAFDLRGHGMSDQSIGNKHYRAAKFWADDFLATTTQL